MTESEQFSALGAIGSKTQKLFQEVVLVLDKDARHNASSASLFVAEAERFSLWAVNLGLFVPGHGSLDYRVRESENIKNMIERFLTNLNDSLTEVLEYCALGIADAVLDDSAVGLQDGESSDDGWGDDSDENVGSDMDLLLDSVKDPIDRLYKLSTWIRNPSSRFTSAKMQAYRRVDPDTGVDFLSVVAAFERNHARSIILEYRKSKFQAENGKKSPADAVVERPAPPRHDTTAAENEFLDGSEYLVNRFAETNVCRRRRFAYWSNHRHKLALQNTYNGICIQQSNLQNIGKSSVLGKLGLGNPDGFPAPLSVTTASRLAAPMYHALDDRSTVSVSVYAPSNWEPENENLIFPPPPKLLPDQKFFECPYCFTLCSKSMANTEAWKAHLIRDLRPYVCTYKDCRNPNQLYDTRHDWLQHENSVHRRVFRCPEHRDRVFYRLEDYQEHIRDGHITASDGIPQALILQASESTLDVPDRHCPVCLVSMKTMNALQKHIALHLERFALFSLPRGVDDGNEGDSRSSQADVDGEGSRAHYFGWPDTLGSNSDDGLASIRISPRTPPDPADDPLHIEDPPSPLRSMDSESPLPTGMFPPSDQGSEDVEELSSPNRPGRPQRKSPSPGVRFISPERESDSAAETGWVEAEAEAEAEKAAETLAAAEAAEAEERADFIAAKAEQRAKLEQIIADAKLIAEAEAAEAEALAAAEAAADAAEPETEPEVEAEARAKLEAAAEAVAAKAKAEVQAKFMAAVAAVAAEEAATEEAKYRTELKAWAEAEVEERAKALAAAAAVEKAVAEARKFRAEAKAERAKALAAAEAAADAAEPETEPEVEAEARAKLEAAAEAAAAKARAEAQRFMAALEAADVKTRAEAEEFAELQAAKVEAALAQAAVDQAALVKAWAEAEAKAQAEAAAQAKMIEEAAAQAALAQAKRKEQAKRKAEAEEAWAEANLKVEAAAQAEAAIDARIAEEAAAQAIIVKEAAAVAAAAAAAAAEKAEIVARAKEFIANLDAEAKAEAEAVLAQAKREAKPEPETETEPELHAKSKAAADAARALVAAEAAAAEAKVEARAKTIEAAEVKARAQAQKSRAEVESTDAERDVLIAVVEAADAEVEVKEWAEAEAKAAAEEKLAAETAARAAFASGADIS